MFFENEFRVIISFSGEYHKSFFDEIFINIHSFELRRIVTSMDLFKIVKEKISKEYQCHFIIHGYLIIRNGSILFDRNYSQAQELLKISKGGLL